MADSAYKTVMPGVQTRVGSRMRSIRFSCMVNGTRFSKTYDDAPFDALIDRKGRALRPLKDAYNAWKTSCEEKLGVVSRYGLREPTLGELVAAYERFATERSRDPRFLKPREKTISNALKNFRLVMAEGGLSDDDVYTQLFNEETPQRIFDSFLRPERKIAGVSAWSYLSSMQTLTSPWTRPYYERLGFLVRGVKMPDAGLVRDPPRYRRPSQELLDRQDLFYASLQEREDKQLFLVASMVLHLAMRPEDVGNLTAENFFQGQDGRIYLSYVPMKTMHSSKRRVTWPVPEALWEQIRTYAGARLDAGLTMIKGIRTVCDRLNPAMRAACGMEDTNKALYEFRKRCIDYVYHHFGVRAAVAISGDSSSTIEYYYYDPAMETMAPTFETVAIGRSPDARASGTGQGTAGTGQGAVGTGQGRATARPQQNPQGAESVGTAGTGQGAAGAGQGSEMAV